jgi:hypothetical protein
MESPYNSGEKKFPSNLTYASFAKAIKSSTVQAGLLAFSASDYLPIRLSGQWQIFSEALPDNYQDKITVARQPVIFTRFPIIPG